MYWLCREGFFSLVYVVHVFFEELGDDVWSVLCIAFVDIVLRIPNGSVDVGGVGMVGAGAVSFFADVLFRNVLQG